VAAVRANALVMRCQACAVRGVGEPVVWRHPQAPESGRTPILAADRVNAVQIDRTVHEIQLNAVGTDEVDGVTPP
jgi:hypothetical protein